MSNTFAWSKIKMSDCPADYIPAEMEVTVVRAGDCTLKGFYDPKTGDFHIQEYNTKMTQKSPNINCQCYRDGDCLHHEAPRRWFGKPQCVLLEEPKDPRTKAGCALQYEYPQLSAHSGPPNPPPARVLREGISCDTLMPPPALTS